MTLRLTSRIVIVFLLLAALLLGTVGVLSYRSGTDSLTAAAVAKVLETAIEKEAEVDTWIEKRLADAGRMANQVDIAEKAASLIASTPASDEARTARAILLRELEPHVSGPGSDFTELFVMEPERGNVVASTSPTEEGKSKLGLPYFDHGRIDLYLQAPYQSANLLAPAMTIAVPLRATDGSVIAVLAFRLDLGVMGALVLRGTGLHRTEDSFLVNAAQFPVTQPRFIDEPAVLRRRLDSEAVRLCAAGKSGVVLGEDYRGRQTVTAYRWNARHQLGLIVKVDQDEALAPARAFGRSLVLVSAMALLAAACLAILLARTITRPLRTLHDRVRRFGREHSDEPLRTFAGDEIRGLASDFDQMATRIGERTAELAETNAALHFEIGERTRAEELLRAKEFTLSESQRLGHVGTWFYDMTDPINWSTEMYRLYGVSPGAFTPTWESVLDATHPDDRPAMQAWIAGCATGLRPTELDYRINLPDGTVRFLRTRGQALFDGQHRLMHMAGTALDITERKEADQERETLVALLDNSPDFIGMASLDGKPLYLNKAGRDMVGLGRDFDVSSTRIADYFSDETAGLLKNAAIPASFADGHWLGEGNLRHAETHVLVPVHIHAFLVRHPTTHEPICMATVQRNITDIKDAEAKLEKANRELLEVSRLSGMAEIATSVLHNVGNVLNSVNVSADQITEKIKRLSPASLEKVASLLREHTHDLPDFMTRDPRGKELPGYLSALIEQLADPQRDILPELVLLRKNIEHIRQIVRRQQNYAHATGVVETVALTDLVEDAVRINAASLTRHHVRLIREYSPVPSFSLDKHKVMQILVNLLSNAKYALDAGDGLDSTLTIRIEMTGSDSVHVSVTDNGVGIAAENLSRLFEHGFTTRDGGHGFGLHSGALAAQELGGSLTAYSGGLGRGAAFTLALPCHIREVAA